MKNASNHETSEWAAKVIAYKKRDPTITTTTRITEKGKEAKKSRRADK